MLQLMAAWDQLAARLPPQASSGRPAELILNALKLALAYCPPLPSAWQQPATAGPGLGTAPPSAAAAAADEQGGIANPPPPPLSRPVARAQSLAGRLADLATQGLPVDAEAIAAAILAELLAPTTHPHVAWGPRPAAAAAGGSGSGPLSLSVIEERVGPIVAQLAHDIQRARQLPSRVELLDDTAAR
jgi:hypothetical protein